MIFTWLVALFIAMPILELAVLFKVHHAFGLGNTLAIVVLTGIVGAVLARAQGFRGQTVKYQIRLVNECGVVVNT